VIPSTVEAFLRLLDRPRLERGRLEDALARAGWPWSSRVSLWIDDLVLAEEDWPA
jgi:hypothetical protein